MNKKIVINVGQRAPMLPAVKVGGLRKNSAARSESNQMRAAWVPVLDDWIILKVWQTLTLLPLDLKRLTVPL